MRFRLFALTVFALAVSLTAYGQASRTWVSGVGDDANPCSRTAPCKTFPGAISKTAAGGEINCLDPGGFGTVTITKSITIKCEGELAGILSSGFSAIIINAGVNDRIYIRGLDINGTGGGLTGVKIISAGAVTIDHCEIHGFNAASNGSRGITAISLGALTVKVNVTDTIIRNIQGIGIVADVASGQVSLALDNVRIYDVTQSAVDLETNASATIAHSYFTNNAGAGVLVRRVGTEANVISSVLSRNGFGVNVGDTGGGKVRLANSQVAANTISGIAVNGLPAGCESHGNNAIKGNVLPEACTVVGPQ